VPKCDLEFNFMKECQRLILIGLRPGIFMAVRYPMSREFFLIGTISGGSED
jgi:hypothetical protein